jgi:hypothetical protein
MEVVAKREPNASRAYARTRDIGCARAYIVTQQQHYLKAVAI